MPAARVYQDIALVVDQSLELSECNLTLLNARVASSGCVTE